MEIAKVPSSTIGIIHEDEIVYMNSLGEQTHINTSYHMGSLPKSICATAILQLYEDNLLDIYNPINDYLPFKIENWKSPDVNITIYHLLIHKSGIQITDEYNSNLFLFKNISFPDYLYEFLHINGSKYSQEIFHAGVGTLYEYCNVNYNLLAYLVQIISGKPYEDYLRDNIFKLFGVDNSRFNHTDYPDEMLAKVYYLDSSENLVEAEKYTDLNYGAGSLISAVIDITHFMGAHMNEGIFNGVRLLNETTVELMHSSHADDYGLGWFLERPDLIAEPRIEGFGGLGYGARSYMQFNANQRVGVVLLTNMFDQRYNDENNEIFRYIFKKALKLNEINTEETNSLSATLAILTMLTLVYFLRRRRRRRKKL
ncbi:MAG: beta-lactamase family protein [Asgard group archaeon]|nr:beta-lactamase family protein [Asgard group archaeon]